MWYLFRNSSFNNLMVTVLLVDFERWIRLWILNFIMILIVYLYACLRVRVEILLNSNSDSGQLFRDSEVLRCFNNKMDEVSLMKIIIASEKSVSFLASDLDETTCISHGKLSKELISKSKLNRVSPWMTLNLDAQPAMIQFFVKTMMNLWHSINYAKFKKLTTDLRHSNIFFPM